MGQGSAMQTAGDRVQKLRFLDTLELRDVAADQIPDDEGRIDTGLIDTLAWLELIAFLEAEFGTEL
jgi:acyl carrier protein